MSIDDNKTQKELIETLSLIATDITSALEEEALAIAAQKGVDRILDVDHSGFYFFDPERGRLRLVYVRGFTQEELEDAELTAMDRHPGWVYRNRSILHVPDVEADPERRTSSGPRTIRVRSRLHLPILFRGECVGVFAMASSRPNHFTDFHIASLVFLSNMVGVVHSNLQHIRSITKQIELVRKQRAELRELSAPILMVGRGALLLPVIGRVERTRAEHMQEKLLGAIAKAHARAVILDLTGMAVSGKDAIDALLRIAKAVGLMGARCVLSGITKEAAMAMVDLDVPIRAGDIFHTVEAALASVLR